MPEEEPGAYALRAALAKAKGVLPLIREEGGNAPAPAPLVIAADTVVVLDGKILGKPRNSGEALEMLCALSGRAHTVTTGCALLSAIGSEARSFAVHSRVSMWDCPLPLLRAYACCGEPMDKAGAYAVQGTGAFLVSGIEGSWSNVVGLPLAELVQTLLDMRAITPLA